MTLTLALQKSRQRQRRHRVLTGRLPHHPLVGWLGDRLGRRRMYDHRHVGGAGGDRSGHAGHRLKNLVLGVRRLRRAAQRRGAQPPASLENVSIRRSSAPATRYTLTAIVREIAAVIATGIGPVGGRRVGRRGHRKPDPDHGDAGSVLTGGADRGDMGQGLDWTRPDRPAPGDVTEPNMHQRNERKP